LGGNTYVRRINDYTDTFPIASFVKLNVLYRCENLCEMPARRLICAWSENFCCNIESEVALLCALYSRNAV